MIFVTILFDKSSVAYLSRMGYFPCGIPLYRLFYLKELFCPMQTCHFWVCRSRFRANIPLYCLRPWSIHEAIFFTSRNLFSRERLILTSKQIIVTSEMFKMLRTSHQPLITNCYILTHRYTTQQL